MHHERETAGSDVAQDGEFAGGRESPVNRRGKKWIALALLAALGGLAWKTMEPGKVRIAVVILLAAFLVRVALSAGDLR